MRLAGREVGRGVALGFGFGVTFGFVFGVTFGFGFGVTFGFGVALVGFSEAGAGALLDAAAAGAGARGAVEPPRPSSPSAAGGVGDGAASLAVFPRHDATIAATITTPTTIRIQDRLDPEPRPPGVVVGVGPGACGLSWRWVDDVSV